MASRHMKRCSALLTIMAMPIKTLMRNYFIPATMAIIKKSKKNKYGKKGSLYSVGGNINGFSHCGKEYGGFSRKLQLLLPHYPAIPLLGIHLKTTKIRIQKNTCNPMFMAALFINSQDMEAA